MSIKALVLSFSKTSKAIFDVCLVDHDPSKLNAKFNKTLNKRGTLNFEQKHFVVSGLNMTIKPFKRLIDFKVTSLDSLSYMVNEIEKEIK